MPTGARTVQVEVPRSACWSSATLRVAPDDGVCQGGHRGPDARDRSEPVGRSFEVVKRSEPVVDDDPSGVVPGQWLRSPWTGSGR